MTPGESPWTLRADGEFSRSAALFTEQAYRRLSHGTVSEHNFRQIAGGLRSFMEAGITYRVANAAHRGNNRCRQGILVAEDIREELDTQPAIGLLWEYIGDLGVVGGRADYDDAFRTAAEIYRESDLYLADGWASDPLLTPTVDFFRRLATVAGHDLKDWGGRHGFVDRVQYKSAHYQGIVETATEPERWLD